MNEFLLIASLFVIYGTVLLAYRIFGLHGLYCFTAIATITANIEVLIMVNAFGMEQTLGNILFASTFLVTDIISEVEGKKASQKAVNIGIFTSIFFIIVSQTWMLYQPSASDWAQPAIKTIFSNTPRLMIVSVLVSASGLTCGHITNGGHLQRSILMVTQEKLSGLGTTAPHLYHSFLTHCFIHSELSGACTNRLHLSALRFQAM